MGRKPGYTVGKIALRAGCSAAWTYRLLKRGLTEGQIIERMTKNQARVLVARAASRVWRTDGYIISATLAQELGASRQAIDRRRKDGLSDDQIRVSILYRQALRKVSGSERRVFLAENPPPPFVKIGGGRPRKPKPPKPPKPPRYCDECGGEIEQKLRRRFCSKLCYRRWTDADGRRKRAEALAALPARYCLECGAQILIVSGQHHAKPYCSAACSTEARLRHKRDKALHNGHKGGLLVTMSIARTWPGRSTLVFTPEGLKFTIACLLTSLTFPAIATLLGINACTFKYLLRRTPELTPYRKRHHEIVREVRSRRPVRRVCKRCGKTFECHAKPPRKWCNRCVTKGGMPKPMTAKRRAENRRKRQDYYYLNVERIRLRHREHYARNREKEIEKTRRYKAIKKYGLDPEKWREQWDALHAVRVGEATPEQQRTVQGLTAKRKSGRKRKNNGN
jgi:hypothetical protein